MDKRYQVFVSSTFADLKDERTAVIQTLMQMDCIPAGMELFPALDEEQLEFIKRVIDDCDYYLLIIGGRYGSITKEGISFTEKEYEYAISKGIKVVALIHGAPEAIPSGKTDGSAAARKKLEAFREKAKQGRLVQFWTKLDELPGKVAISMTATIKNYPAVGWVRATLLDQAHELLSELNNVRKQNDQLRVEVEGLRDQLSQKTSPQYQILGLQHMKDHVTLTGHWYNESHEQRLWNKQITWHDIFKVVSKAMFNISNSNTLEHELESYIAQDFYNTGNSTYTFITGGDLGKNPFDAIGVQLMAFGLIEVRSELGGGASWLFTDQGRRLALELHSLRPGESGSPENPLQA